MKTQDPDWIRIGIQPKMLDPGFGSNECGSAPCLNTINNLRILLMLHLSPKEYRVCFKIMYIVANFAAHIH
jgi:hypothetical protein